MTVDYSSKSIAQQVVCEVSDGAGGWTYLHTFSCQIDNNSEIPSAEWVGAYDANLVEGRAFRVRIIAGSYSATTSGIYSGQPDPLIYSGSGSYCGEFQLRFHEDTDNGDNTWFYGILEKPRQLEAGLGVPRYAARATTYLNNMSVLRITNERGYHYGSFADLTVVSGQTRYKLQDISSTLEDIYAVYIGTSASDIVITEELNAWTYDHASQTLHFFFEIPTDAFVRVYGHVAVEPSAVFDIFATAAGIPALYQSSTALAGYTTPRVWFPQGWTYLECMNNLAEQIGYRVYVTRAGVVSFKPRPLSTASATAVWKDGAEADYQLIASIDRTEERTTATKIRVEGARYISSQYTTKKALIADHSDGSNINLWGGRIETFRDSLTSSITPGAGSFYPQYEFNNRVAKIVGTNAAGASGIRWYLSPTQATTDISGYTYLKFVGRGNGATVQIVLEGSGTESIITQVLPNYQVEYTLAISDFVGSADTSAIVSVSIRQTSIGRIDFSIDNLGFTPESATDVVRSQREILIAAEVGTTSGDEITLRYQCLADSAEALSLATARLAREQQTRYRHKVAIPHAQDPANDVNVLAAVTTSKYSYTAEKMEIVGYEIGIGPNASIDFAYECAAPLTATFKSTQVGAAATDAFTADSMTFDSSDQTSPVVFSHEVASTSDSPWNAQYLYANQISATEARAIADASLEVDFDKTPAVFKANDAQVLNITAGTARSTTATSTSLAIQLGHLVGAVDANNAQVYNIVDPVESLSATSAELVIVFERGVVQPESIQIYNMAAPTAWED